MTSYEEQKEEGVQLLAALSQPKFLREIVQNWNITQGDIDQTKPYRNFYLNRIEMVLADNDTLTGRLIRNFADSIEQRAEEAGAPHPAVVVLGDLNEMNKHSITGYTFKVLYNQIFENDPDLTHQAMVGLNSGYLKAETVKDAVASFKWNTPVGQSVREKLTADVMAAFAKAMGGQQPTAGGPASPAP